MKNVSKNFVIRDQLQKILRAWGVKDVVPVKGDFKLSLSFPNEHLNRATVRKTHKKSTYNKPLYEIVIFRKLETA